ncbi:sugar transferase [Aureispira anguillae]|uniref:Sugar transferase n=1 Tax=Aureispira anguillae TaxID=2864201 RepID=A0A915YMI0_9BACT|nr:sugar transferase [Aureispira anguillae]BDS15543.1 sugar transferase [Aureispira anguillae]
MGLIRITRSILYIGNDNSILRTLVDWFDSDYDIYQIGTPLEAFSWLREGHKTPALILIENTYSNIKVLDFSNLIKQRFGHKRFQMLVLVKNETEINMEKARNNHVVDIFEKPLINTQKERLVSLMNNQLKKEIYEPKQGPTLTKFKIPTWKRTFDILVAGTALLILSPLLILVAFLIKLDSKGAVFYTSKRVGSGYKIFDFYKFRTMKIGADKELDALKKEKNQYQKKKTGNLLEQQVCENCIDGDCTQLVIDNHTICERQFLAMNKNKQAAFVKLSRDPRITRLGRFLRNTSIDELPQLFNILKGDMSIVGNRPLPLYEAEQLTTDHGVQRFAAPAGLTGLWQVRKRGQKDMSEEERKNLDNEYAQNYTFWLDLKLIFQTIGVFIQKENV